MHCSMFLNFKTEQAYLIYFHPDSEQNSVLEILWWPLYGDGSTDYTWLLSQMNQINQIYLIWHET